MPPSRRWNDAHRALWQRLWTSPQAWMWDDASYAQTVAMYVSHAVKVMTGTAAAWQAQEARHLGNALGLSPQGMHALGWRLAAPGEDATPNVVELRSVR